MSTPITFPTEQRNITDRYFPRQTPISNTGPAIAWDSCSLNKNAVSWAAGGSSQPSIAGSFVSIKSKSAIKVGSNAVLFIEQCSRLDQLLAPAGQRPRFDRLGQRQRPHGCQGCRRVRPEVCAL